MSFAAPPDRLPAYLTTVMAPYVPGGLRDETRRVLLRCGLPVRWCRIDPADDCAYGRLVRQWWAERCGFMVVEHDMVPSVAQLQTMAACPRPWCTHRYDCGGRLLETGLGVAKFSLTLLAQHPATATSALARRGPDGGGVRWRSVDQELARDLMVRGVRPHVHPGVVEHIH